MKQSFKEWHAELLKLAKQNNAAWLVPRAEDYPHDGYDDGCSPEDELETLISYCD